MATQDSANALPFAALPRRAGIGLRAPHHADLLASLPDVGWLEVHSENFFGAGGAPHYYLEQAAHHYPLSFHGVALSLGTAGGVDATHLARLKALVERYQPAAVSEHISWSTADGTYLNDLLPLPYSREAADSLVRNIDHVQTTLGRQILIENPSAYLELTDTSMSEADFIREVTTRSGCGLLLDINNVYVTAMNMGRAPEAELLAMPFDVVGEVHLAGHLLKDIDGDTIRIDTHDNVVCDDVWALYRTAISQLGAAPTLIEWDANLPELNVLVAEAAKAQAIMDTTTANIETETQTNAA